MRYTKSLCNNYQLNKYVYRCFMLDISIFFGIINPKFSNLPNKTIQKYVLLLSIHRSHRKKGNLDFERVRATNFLQNKIDRFD